ncbi:UDP-N-acetylmuramoyl-tripeptide--D-alanyl-D-alanine ligase [Fictibacillus gelatini]|uniref:UDP-N-acetylmuramoyl-tripeptide--D-alanyl-D- alanine ligase n=1 Tax=Fictibacillus gelatini TaxID=225985 RepID=UPI0003FCCEF6|nr:UDP-N-acetylmuramoyl-tripeptide--D-alanyl-D-alanine ligase [Fictibacillus gelatini]
MKMLLKDYVNIALTTRGNVENTIIQEVTKDTRVPSVKSLYVPIIGERFNGHHFLMDAIKNGAIAAIWKQGEPLPDDLDPSFPILFVEDTISALQKMAKLYLKKIRPIVIGVTGSNGKTTTKDMVESVAATTFKTHKTKGNYNNHIGLPLTILSMPEQTEVLILEMGMSGFGEISLLSKIAEPDVAIITNIGESHIEALGSREGIAKAKLEIKDGLKESGVLIIDGDEPLLEHVCSKNVLKCGYNENSTLHIDNIEGDENGYSFQLEGGTTTYYLPLLGKHNVKNAVYAIAVGHYLNIEENAIKEGLMNLTMTKMRLEKYKGQKGALLINDAYNASPTSMIAAIEAIKGLNNYPKKVVVLGDMYELGNEEESMHRAVAPHITTPITEAVTIGEKGRWIGEELKTLKPDGVSVSIFPTKEEAKEYIGQKLSKDTVILFKASRGMQMETLVKEFIDEEEARK